MFVPQSSFIFLYAQFFSTIFEETVYVHSKCWDSYCCKCMDLFLDVLSHFISICVCLSTTCCVCYYGSVLYSGLRYYQTFSVILFSRDCFDFQSCFGFVFVCLFAFALPDFQIFSYSIRATQLTSVRFCAILSYTLDTVPALQSLFIHDSNHLLFCSVFVS